MKFLFRSGWGESLAIARRVESEGNLVRFSIVEPKARRVGDGLITKTNDFIGGVSWADVVVFDSNNFDMPKEAERVRESGKPTIGSSAFAGQLEDDRQLAADLAEGVGIEVPYYYRFKGKSAWVKARQFLAEHGDEDPDGWVWKHCGKSETASTFVGSVDEMSRMLTYFEKLYVKAKENPDFILTTKISGVEVSTEAWFNGSDFVLANNTIEKNRFFPGDLGEKTGCAGNVVWTYRECRDSKLFMHLLNPLKESLTGRYCGPVDVNALIDEENNEPIFLEFTPRFGYDAIFTLAHLVESDLAGLFADMGMGRTWRGRFNDSEFAGAIRIHTPPYPEEEEGRGEDIPVFGFDPEKIDKGVSPCEIMIDETGEPVTSGPNGYVFVLSKLGSTVEEAMKIDVGVNIPLMRYRNDLAGELGKCYDELVTTEWAGKGRRGGQLFGRGS